MLAKEPYISPSLLAAIRIQLAEGKDELDMLDQALTGPISERNEKKALCALSGALQSMLAGMPASCRQEGQGIDVRLAEKYVNEEKNVLMKGIEMIKEMQGKLKSFLT